MSRTGACETAAGIQPWRRSDLTADGTAPLNIPAFRQGQPDPLAHPWRRAPDRGHHHRHHRDGRKFPRARAGQRQTRTGKHRVAAGPPLRSAAGRFRRHPGRPRRLRAVRRHRDQRALQAPDVRCRHSPDAQDQARGIVLCRRRQPVRFGRRADQFIERLASPCHQRRRSGLFQEPSNRTRNRRRCWSNRCTAASPAPGPPCLPAS